MHAGVTNRLPEPLASVLKCATLRAQENERCSVTDEMANVFLRSVEFATVSLGKKVLARPADFFGIAMFPRAFFFGQRAKNFGNSCIARSVVRGDT